MKKLIFVMVVLMALGCQERSHSISDDLNLTVDYGRNLKDMIIAGQYDWEDSYIDEGNFPLPVELSGNIINLSGKLFKFDESITSRRAYIIITQAGYRPAKLPELLALGKAYPELQRQFPIVALGSKWHPAASDIYVCCLHYNFNGRILCLEHYYSCWSRGYNFLAIRE